MTVPALFRPTGLRLFALLLALALPSLSPAQAPATPASPASEGYRFSPVNQ